MRKWIVIANSMGEITSELVIAEGIENAVRAVLCNHRNDEIKAIFEIATNEREVSSDDICVVCGAELPTESGRMICKECEEKAK